MLGEPLFKGSSCWGQMYKIIAALGTPSTDEVHSMKPGRGCQRLVENVSKLANTHRAPTSWSKLLPAYAGDVHALDLTARLLVYSPEARLHPSSAISHPFFSELLTAETSGPEDEHLIRVLFNKVTHEELANCSSEVQSELRRLSARCEISVLEGSGDTSQVKG